MMEIDDGQLTQDGQVVVRQPRKMNFFDAQVFPSNLCATIIITVAGVVIFVEYFDLGNLFTFRVARFDNFGNLSGFWIDFPRKMEANVITHVLLKTEISHFFSVGT